MTPDAVLRASIGDVPGVVALAANRDGVIYEGAFGERALGSGIAMTLDTVFWVASMTKVITSTCALQLVERGLLELDAPLPQLAHAQVLVGFDHSGSPLLRAPARPVTLRHLLTHTAGFGYDVWNPMIYRYLEYVGPSVVGRDRFLGTPLLFDPGERWEYGVNTDWVGAVVEEVSGETLDAYMRTNVFEPLGMHDTGFVLSADQRARLVGRHQRQRDGSLTVVPYEVPPMPTWFMGGGGLYSTGPDYLRFLRALLAGGEGILQRNTVEDMCRNHIGDIPAGVLRSVIAASSFDHDPYPGQPIRWGLGGMLNLEAFEGGRAAGSLAWAGLANTYWWLDPTHGITSVLMTQILPFADPTVLRIYADFERAVYNV
jgi:CubicO group peptidase (beta-lactamase class C family)